MDWETLRVWLALLQIMQILVTAAVGIAAWRISRGRARRAEIVSLQDEIGGVRTRVHDVEADLRHLPKHADLQSMGERLEQVHRDLRELSGAFGGLRRAVDLMNQYLLDHRDKGDR